jgi:hypothetical protein
MCRPVQCKTCGKTTWAGCGQHVDQVKAAVAAGQWCGGHEPAAQSQGQGGDRKGLLSRLLGR